METYNPDNHCAYMNMGSFTVVVTPHAVARAHERDFNGKLPWFTLFNTLECDNRNQYAVVGGRFQCFMNKKYNTIRCRWELEVISFTPNTWTRACDKCIMRLA
jgi:hypothetical protein